MKKTIRIIAEIGVNHNGDPGLAKKLIEAAGKAGADIVKFQAFRPESMASRKAPMARYQVRNTGKPETQFEMISRLALSMQDFRKLSAHAKRLGLGFLVSPFDLESLSVVKDLKLKSVKVPSGEITNLPLLKAIGRLGIEVILSTGMSCLEEIGRAVRALTGSGAPRSRMTLLHCTTEYPAPYAEVNLRAMLTLQKTFGLPVGYSDHTIGLEVPFAAVAMGASVIEKHFTLDPALPGPDHKASMAPDQFSRMVKGIRNIEAALGSARKVPTASERRNMRIARKSIHTASALASGHVLKSGDLALKRPGDGLGAEWLPRALGRRLKRALPADYKLKRKDF